MNPAKPLELYTDIVRPEWVDYNGHLNVGYYIVAFDLATDAFLDHLGYVESFRTENSVSTFTLESHATYERELTAGAPIRFTTQLLAFDTKRIHYVHCMYHGEDGYLASANELISVNVDMVTRRASEMRPEILERLEETHRNHSALPQPPQVGRVMGLTSKRPRA